MEKPCGENPSEGELIARAMVKYRELIRMGDQRRSMPTLIEAASLVKGGVIGNAYFAQAWYDNNPKSSCNDYPVEGSRRGFFIYGDKGSLVNLGGGDDKLFDEKNKLVKEVKPDVVADPSNTVSANGNLDLYHFQNFVEGIRRSAHLNAPVTEANKSVLPCQLANVLQRTGNMLHCDPANRHIIDDALVKALWKREYEPGWEPIV